ncbi:Valacyclovir hydrolase [Mizuhopecten yessoensis]|uniref:Valacyclovir hydrolase n=2 Tax=Mizuhopecten yessoensis TaxID=6573 RepID=A0A210QXU6_MIZYE|nr:Valacyclovir hydrolase [Mizuhopecten yessoensis]
MVSLNMSRRITKFLGTCTYRRFIVIKNHVNVVPEIKTSIQTRRQLATGNVDPGFFAKMQQARTKLADADKQSAIVSHKEKVNGMDIHFETTGDGQEILLLLPGALGSTRTDFEKQLTGFNKSDYTLVAMDPQGYGRSIPPERTWPLEYLQRDADDALQLCKTLGLRKISVLGWSDGGNTGMILAAKEPALVSKLVVWGANAYFTEQDINAFEKIRDISSWSDRMREPFVKVYGEEYFQKHWSKWVDACQAYYNDREGNIFMDDLKNITAKTLIIHGVKDALVEQEHPDYLHANIKCSELFLMPEGKHNLHIRYSKEFNSLVEEFLKK